jgi:phage gp36-like protein
MAAFATPAQLLQRYDYRLIGQLISDTGTAIDAAAILTDPITAQMLEDGSGLIVSYALKGGRYSEADLAALTGNGQAFLERLTCDLALYYFVQRRGLPVDKYPQVADAMDWLVKLSEGDLVFPIAANIEAGVAQSEAILVPTIVEQNFLTNSVRYFPTNRWTLPQIGG